MRDVKTETAEALVGGLANVRMEEPVDTERLARVLGGRRFSLSWPRRVLQRPPGHPAGALTTDDLEGIRAQARTEGRSVYDAELELLALNGWTPEDEAAVQAQLHLLHPGMMRHHDGATPFLDRWEAAGRERVRKEAYRRQREIPGEW